jgi:hypothetical protein
MHKKLTVLPAYDYLDRGRHVLLTLSSGEVVVPAQQADGTSVPIATEA